MQSCGTIIHTYSVGTPVGRILHLGIVDFHYVNPFSGIVVSLEAVPFTLKT